MIRCWSHENFRVYGDRLINEADRKWFKDLVSSKITEDFGMQITEVFDKERLLFADFMGGSGADTKFYVEIDDLPKMKKMIEEFLEDYNAQSSIQMPLVMFYDACEHIARISRVIRQPQGNALLLGVGGSGRQSLSRLASFISEYACYQIEVAKGYGMNEFKEDLKTCLLKCGAENKTQTFLFCDTQIVKEQMVEALNNVLNSGDVPNLYKIEDIDTITQNCRAACQSAGFQPTKSNIFNTYLQRVRANVHVVLAFSPVGDAFRTRLRMFPSLVNCCTIDWFAEWPAEALYSVGHQQLTQEDLQLGSYMEGVLNTFKDVHQTVERSAHKFLDMVKRHVYVTPTSYLELISGFKKVLALKRKEVGFLKDRLQKGLEALASAEYAVANMETELREMQPVLVKTQKEVADMETELKEMQPVLVKTQK